MQKKLIIGMGLMMALVLGTATFLFFNRGQSILNELMSEHARQLATMVSHAAAQPFVEKDSRQLKQLGEDMIRNRNILAAAFFDVDGKMITMSGNVPSMDKDDWRIVETQLLMRVRERDRGSGKKYLMVTAPVLSATPGRPDDVKLLGYLTVGVTTTLVEAELHRVLVISSGVCLTLLTLFLPLTMAMVHRIFLPIRHLLCAVMRIAQGDYTTKVEMERRDEIGQLARSFNEMADKIHEHREELRQANRDLEAKVLKRTEELEATNKRLSGEISEKEDFLRAVSHDLTAPLRNIGGMATLILTRFNEGLKEDVVHRLERIRKNVEIENDLIGELLELSRIRTRRHKMERVDLGEMVRELGECFETDFNEKRIDFVIATKLPTISCERLRIRQIFQNLIDNAIKYMGEGAERRIEVGHEEREDGYEFYVRDTGMGICKEDLSRVFYVFRRGKNTATANVEGKGIGLASVKTIVETYGGQIFVESDVGRGSVFRFSIPRESDKQTPVAA